jgi:hypothetical protein
MISDRIPKNSILTAEIAGSSLITCRHFSVIRFRVYDRHATFLPYH